MPKMIASAGISFFIHRTCVMRCRKGVIASILDGHWKTFAAPEQSRLHVVRQIREML
jgi:hypothetical protein